MPLATYSNCYHRQGYVIINMPKNIHWVTSINFGDKMLNSEKLETRFPLSIALFLYRYKSTPKIYMHSVN